MWWETFFENGRFGSSHKFLFFSINLLNILSSLSSKNKTGFHFGCQKNHRLFDFILLVWPGCFSFSNLFPMLVFSIFPGQFPPLPIYPPMPSRRAVLPNSRAGQGLRNFGERVPGFLWFLFSRYDFYWPPENQRWKWIPKVFFSAASFSVRMVTSIMLIVFSKKI